MNLVDGAHTALPEFFLNLVVAEALTFIEGVSEFWLGKLHVFFTLGYLCFYASQCYGKIDRLHDVVVGALVKSLYHVFTGTFACNHDDGKLAF